MSTGDSSRPAAPENGPDELGEEEEFVRSRTSLKKERVNNEKALSKLVKDLLPLNEDKWEKLGVPDETVDALLDGKKIKSHGAKERHMRLIRATLRGADWTLVRRRLDQMRAGFAISQPSGEGSSAAQIWSEQLLVQGDPGLARFVEEFEGADRQRLRQLVRNVLRAPDNKRGKAREQLERAVEQVVQAATDDS